MKVDQGITQEDAIVIAGLDAEKVSRNLEIYEVVVSLEDDVWYVDYELKDKTMLGGGSHCVVSTVDGTVLERRYEQ